MMEEHLLCVSYRQENWCLDKLDGLFKVTASTWQSQALKIGLSIMLDCLSVPPFSLANPC